MMSNLGLLICKGVASRMERAELLSRGRDEEAGMRSMRATRS